VIVLINIYCIFAIKTFIYFENNLIFIFRRNKKYAK
jgi:hypothetical protein